MDSLVSFWEKKGNGLELAILRLRPIYDQRFAPDAFQKAERSISSIKDGPVRPLPARLTGQTQHAVVLWSSGPQTQAECTAHI